MMFPLSRLASRKLPNSVFPAVSVGAARHRPYSSSPAKSPLPKKADIVVIGGGSVGCSTLYHLAKMGYTNSILLEKNKLTSGTTWHTAVRRDGAGLSTTATTSRSQHQQPTREWATGSPGHPAVRGGGSAWLAVRVPEPGNRGLLWRLRPYDIDIELTDVTWRLNREILPKESGMDTGWIENGGLFVAATKERLDEYMRLMSLGKVYGVESRVLTPAETLDVYPLMNVDDVYGSLYSPGDGLVDPTGWCESLTRVAKNLGCQVREFCPVTDIITETEPVFGYKKVTGVRTQEGVIETNAVALCTGAWGPKLGAKIGVNIPTVAVKHAYVNTDTIKGVKNLPNVRDHDISVYIRLQGDALGIGGYEPHPEFWENVEDDFAFGLFDLNWDNYGMHLEAATKRIPALADVGVKSEVCGPISFTPDHRPMMGEAPGVRGLFLGCGMDLGMMMGGGLGQQLAQWIIRGRPEMHMYRFDIARLASKITGNQQWLKERAHECHVTMYKAVIPHDEFLSARNLRKTPFHDHNLQNGAVFEERHGWERPGWFATDGRVSPVLPYDWYGAYSHTKRHDNYVYRERLAGDQSFDWPTHQPVISQEALACRNNVVVFDMSYFGKFFLTGPGSQEAVDWIFSNNLQKDAGNTVYTTMLNKFGGIEADLTVSTLESGTGTAVDPVLKNGEKGFYIAVGGGVAEHCWRHITTALQDRPFDIRLENITESIGMLSVQGPKSRALLSELIPNESFDNDSFPFGTNKVVDIRGHKCRLLRVSFVGEMGWELHIPVESCEAVHKALFEVGEIHGLKNAGYRAMDSLSVEKGYRFWDGDIRHSDSPLESAMMYTCKMKTDTDFLGRKALEEIKKQGMKQRIVCVTIDDHVPLWGLEAIFRDGVPVGLIRRAEYAHILGKPIGYGYISRPDREVLKTDWIKSGKYHIERMGVEYPAQVYLKSPFDPDNKRIQGVYEEDIVHIIP